MSYHDYLPQKGKQGGVPPRWLGCPRKSLQLLVDKFLVYKTPLNHKYDDEVPDECKFLVDFVFSSMKSYKLKLGLWIDLTYTSRFYDKEEVERHECKYVKIQCRGFGMPPTEEQTQLFIHICKNFISQHPLEIIGLHCTHGFNRSGFLVVAFLVEIYDWDLRAAILKFAEVRPPGIYKKDYLEELYRRYDDIKYVPEPPPLPYWCYDEEEVQNDEGYDNNDTNDTNDNEDDNDELEDEEEEEEETTEKGSSGDRKKNRKRKSDKNGESKRKKRKVEFVKKNPTFMAGVPGVEPVTEPALGEIQKTVQKMCDWYSTGFPGSQPVSMKNSNIDYLAKKKYKVSWKADGVRYLMYIRKKDEVFFIDRDNCVFKVKNMLFPRRLDLNQHLKDTLLDGEMVIDKFNGQNIPRYLVYDVIMLDKYPIKKKDFFPGRYEAIRKEVTDPRRKAMENSIIYRAMEPFSVRAKEFLDIEHSAKFLSDKFCENLGHEPDGLIFQPSKGPYVPGQCETLLKWKPPSLNSVDFKLKITTEKGVGIVPKKIGELYVGGSNSRYGVLKSVKNLQDLNNKIIECKFENNSWVFMRERTDKSYPNSFETAQSVSESIFNPVTQEMLLSYIETSRYTEAMPPPMAPPPRSHSSRHYYYNQ